MTKKYFTHSDDHKGHPWWEKIYQASMAKDAEGIWIIPTIQKCESVIGMKIHYVAGRNYIEMTDEEFTAFLLRWG